MADMDSAWRRISELTAETPEVTIVGGLDSVRDRVIADIQGLDIHAASDFEQDERQLFLSTSRHYKWLCAAGKQPEHAMRECGEYRHKVMAYGQDPAPEISDDDIDKWLEGVSDADKTT